MATRREQMLEMLRAEGQRARRQQMPEQSEPDFWEQTLGVASNVAPTIGTLGGTVIGAGLGLLGGPAAPLTVPAAAALGGSIGGGLGSLVGIGAGMAEDHMRSERERMDREAEELEMQRLAKHQALLSLL